MTSHLGSSPCRLSRTGPDSSSESVQGGHVAGGALRLPDPARGTGEADPGLAKGRQAGQSRAGQLVDQGAGSVADRRPESEFTLFHLSLLLRPPPSLCVCSPSSLMPATPTPSFVSALRPLALDTAVTGAHGEDSTCPLAPGSKAADRPPWVTPCPGETPVPLTLVMSLPGSGLWPQEWAVWSLSCPVR